MRVGATHCAKLFMSLPTMASIWLTRSPNWKCTKASSSCPRSAWLAVACTVARGLQRAAHRAQQRGQRVAGAQLEFQLQLLGRGVADLGFATCAADLFVHAGRDACDGLADAGELIGHRAHLARHGLVAGVGRPLAVGLDRGVEGHQAGVPGDGARLATARSPAPGVAVAPKAPMPESRVSRLSDIWAKLASRLARPWSAVRRVASSCRAQTGTTSVTMWAAPGRALPSLPGPGGAATGMPAAAIPAVSVAASRLAAGRMSMALPATAAAPARAAGPPSQARPSPATASAAAARRLPGPALGGVGAASGAVSSTRVVVVVIDRVIRGLYGGRAGIANRCQGVPRRSVIGRCKTS
jgi:hypothetical protein